MAQPGIVKIIAHEEVSTRRRELKKIANKQHVEPSEELIRSGRDFLQAAMVKSVPTQHRYLVYDYHSDCLKCKLEFLQFKLVPET